MLMARNYLQTLFVLIMPELWNSGGDFYLGSMETQNARTSNYQLESATFTIAVMPKH